MLSVGSTAGDDPGTSSSMVDQSFLSMLGFAEMPPRTKPQAEKIRVETIYDAGFFPEYLRKQFLQLLAARGNPEEPGLQFDYAMMYDIYDRNYRKMFRDLVNGEYDQTWDAFVEAWHNRDEDRDHLIFTEEELAQ